MTEEENKNNKEPNNNYNHLKWPSIILAALIVLIIVAFDYCSRVGDI